MSKEQFFKIATPFRIVLMIAIISTATLVWQFGWLKVKDSIYQKGVDAGKVEINNLIIQNLNQFGQIKITAPDTEGKIQTIILVPQK